MSPRADRVRRNKVSPGGVGDGLPAMPDGEPLLARWFVLAMIPLVIGAIVVTILMFVAIAREPIGVAERRPPGTAEVTHERGQAVLAEDETADLGPGCADEIELIGDTGGRATGDRVLRAVCSLLSTGDYPDAEVGLDRWAELDGVLRIAVFEATGVEATSRVERGAVVMELNPRFQFEDAARAAPMVLHELVHLAGAWPGTAVSAETELAAMRVQAAACDAIDFGDNPPRGCGDARELLAADDPLGLLVEAGYRPE